MDGRDEMDGRCDPKWLEWARLLRATAQSGLTYTENAFDRGRFREVQAIAAEILACYSGEDPSMVRGLLEGELGYATPKVDVRGVVFHERKILLVRETADGGRWTVPGGWADIHETPSEAAVREVFEESGFRTRADKLLAVYDRNRQGLIPPYPWHVYKMFFLCERIGGEAATSIETSEVAFFGEDEIPELSVPRVNDKQIARFFEHLRRPELPTDFD